MRFFSLFDAGSAAFIDGEVGSYKGKGQAETSLLRRLLSRLEKNSILVLDRFFTSPDLRKEIEQNEINYVIRARDKQAQKTLKSRSDVTIEENKVQVRYIKSVIKRPGFRVAKLYIMTNLFKKDGHLKEDIEKLYLKRWSVEVDIRNLKQTLEGHTLRSKSTDMVIKELWAHMIAYNLVRGSIEISSRLSLKPPRKHSFKLHVEGTLLLMGNVLGEDLFFIFSLLSGEILNSKYRREPRAIRFLGKKYEEMKMSRNNARKRNWGKSGKRDRKALLAKKAA